MNTSFDSLPGRTGSAGRRAVALGLREVNSYSV